MLADLGCGVVETKVWTHKGRIACLISVKDEHSGSPIGDAERIRQIESRLLHVLKRGRASCNAVSSKGGIALSDRRLHQMMSADGDHESTSSAANPSPSPSVSVQNWIERGYSVVTVQSRDRPKLLFDVVCTLTDMEYVVFHGTIDTRCDLALQVSTFAS